MATNVCSLALYRLDLANKIFGNYRAASKDPELESTYLKLLKETSPHEKAITRDLGRFASVC